jgi:hypothetical protein
MYTLYMYIRLLIFTIKFIANDITEILLKVAININPTIYIFISQKTIAIHRYRELQNYLQIYTCTITVTEKQKYKTIYKYIHVQLQLQRNRNGHRD